MDLNRLRKLSGIITEGFDPDRRDDSKQEIITLFNGLLDVLKKEYAEDENMKGIVYHFEESLENSMRDHGDDEDDYDYGEEYGEFDNLDDTL